MKAIDLFAGLGGFTLGAERAGLRVVWASNHSSTAVRWHAANHPRTAHVCQDLQQADFTEVPRHDVQLAGPACQGHSQGRGKEKPHHDKLRATAWAVVTAAEVHRPSALVTENVPRFLRWSLFPSWVDALKRLGYTVSPHILDAADFGVPQNRLRAIIVATRSKAPFVVKAPMMPHVPAASILDPDDQCEWGRIRHLCENTRRRCRTARRIHGDRFLVPYYSSKSADKGRSLSRPIGTITTVARYGLVSGDRYRMLKVSEYRRAMGFPENHLLPANAAEAIELLGNAVPPPMAEGIIKQLAA